MDYAFEAAWPLVFVETYKMATKIQRVIRGFIVRRRPEIQNMKSEIQRKKRKRQRERWLSEHNTGYDATWAQDVSELSQDIEDNNALQGLINAIQRNQRRRM